MSGAGSRQSYVSLPGKGVLIRGQLSKLLLPGVILAWVAFLLPLIETRENRVSSAVPLFLSDASPWAVIILLLPAAALFFLLFFSKSESKSESEWRNTGAWITTSAGFLGALFFLTAADSGLREILPSSGRIGLGPGIYLYLLAMAFPWFGMGFSRIRSIISGMIIVLTAGLLVYSGRFGMLGIIKEGVNQGPRLYTEIVNHLRITFFSVFAASLLGTGGAFLAVKSRTAKRILFTLVNIFQTIPSIALFGLLIAPLAWISRQWPVLRELGIRGIGEAPAIIALTAYSIFPVLRNSYAGITEISPRVIDASKGMGMSQWQLMRIVILPSAAPVILYGIRLASIQTLGNAVLAKLIGAGGLGILIFEGLSQYSVDMVLLGIILLAFLTLSLDIILRAVIWISTPRALRLQYSDKNEKDPGNSE